MQRGMTGHHEPQLVAGEKVRAFVPDALPPVPALVIDDRLREQLDQATLALGRLDGISALLPHPDLFLYLHVRKEAVLSSQIEGTQSSVSDLLLHENDELPGVPVDDVEDVSRYVTAMNHGLKRLRGGFPLSLRLLREIHAKLLAGGRGADKEPGEFRRTQNWIGGSRPGNARFVPPPPHRVGECLGALEKFLHDQPVRTTAVLKAALAHVQFETIHPFLDGNGRLGRLLITLLLCSEGVLAQPMLYLSLHFKQHRADYYELLTRVRETGDWEAWLAFFLDGVRATAAGAVETTHRLLAMFEHDRALILKLGTSAPSALALHDHLKRRPITSIGKAAKALGLTFPTVTTALKNLEKLKLVKETSGRARNRLFAYHPYLKILDEGTEPLPR